jgi:nucleosome binding factor SPN SPT16 subunit
MCNGWKNRETWLVNLWFGDMFAMDVDDGVEITADYIRDIVENYVDEIVPAASFIADMMDMNAIDYDELARHYAPETADAE